MKKIITLIVLGLLTVSYAFSQSFSTSGLKPGEIANFPDKSVTATYFITQSTSQSIISGNSVGCHYTLNGFTTENFYLRVFDLPNQFGINNPINITSIDFGIELASAGTGGAQPVTVNIFTLSGPLQFSNLVLIASQVISVPDQTLSMMNVPISAAIPAGSVLVVEIFTPDGEASGNTFYIGSNNLPQTGPSYIAAPLCGITEPVTTEAIGFADMHYVMNVYATDPVEPVPLNSWAIFIGLILMTSFILFRIKR
jgi:hypothetical protein